jgi:hypothetical protein
MQVNPRRGLWSVSELHGARGRTNRATRVLILASRAPADVQHDLPSFLHAIPCLLARSRRTSWSSRWRARRWRCWRRAGRGVWTRRRGGARSGVAPCVCWRYSAPRNPPDDAPWRRGTIPTRAFSLHHAHQQPAIDDRLQLFAYLRVYKSIPAFTAALTLNAFESNTLSSTMGASGK